MASPSRRPQFLMTQLLGVLRSALRAGEYLTEAEIRHRIEHSPRARDYDYFMFWAYHDWHAWVVEALQDLETLGLVEAAGAEHGAPGDGTQRWGLRTGWMAEDRDGGRDGGQPPRAGGGDERPGDGSLREVLAHRYLFALSDRDFDTVLNNALAEE